MGRRGPTRAPDAAKLRKGETRLSRLGLEPLPRHRLPAMPEGLDPVARAAWRHAVREMGTSGLSHGQPTIPALYVALEPEEEALVLASLDPLRTMAGTDDEMLRALLAEVGVDSDALAAILAELTPPRVKDGRTDPDDIPAPPDEPTTRRGNLCLLGGHRPLCGDTGSVADLDRLLDGVQVSLLATDPPTTSRSSREPTTRRRRDGRELRRAIPSPRATHLAPQPVHRVVPYVVPLTEDGSMAITATEARKNLFPLIEQVNEDRTPVEITSRRGDAVLISRAEYDSLEATAHLLRAPANARRVLESLQQALSGRRDEHELSR